MFLRVLPSLFGPIFKLLRFLPAPLRNWLEFHHPELFIGTELILKREKSGWEEEFDNEKKIYNLLRPLQGSVIPRFFGEVECPKTERTGSRALILADIGGVALCEEGAGSLDVEHLRDLLWQTIHPVSELKVEHDDVKLDNYHLVGNKIMMIDFDVAYIFKDDEPEFVTNSAVAHLLRAYKNVHGN